MPCSSEFYASCWSAVKLATLPITTGFYVISQVGTASAIQEESFSFSNEWGALLDNSTLILPDTSSHEEQREATEWNSWSFGIACGPKCTDTFVPQFSNPKFVAVTSFSDSFSFNTAPKLPTFKAVDEILPVETANVMAETDASAGTEVPEIRDDSQIASLPDGILIPWDSAHAIEEIDGLFPAPMMTVDAIQAWEFGLGIPTELSSLPLHNRQDGQNGGLDAAIANVPILPTAVFPESNGPMGRPVPWEMTQAMPAPAQTMPFSTAPGAGNWVMMWVPYGTPTAPTGPGASVPGVFPSPQQPYYPAWIPGTLPAQGTPLNPMASPYPHGIPGTVPLAPGVIPWGGTATVGSGSIQGPLGQSFNPASPYPTSASAGIPQQLYPGQYLVFPVAPAYPGMPIPGNIANPLGNIGSGESLPVPAAPNGLATNATLPNPPTAISVPVMGAPTGAVVPAILPPNMNSNPGVSQLPTPSPPAAPVTPVAPVVSPPSSPVPTQGGASALGVDMVREPLTEPRLEAQGLAIVQEGDFSSRARVSGSAFLTPSVFVGGTLDFVNGPDLTDDDGLQVTELFVAGSVPSAPGLRFRLGQLDLTSYFDRNSFAKDISRDFFNDTFQTNPALFAGANVTASRPAGLVQWAATDDITLTASAFSSDSDITDFDLNGFAAEASVRTGNLIVRGTFLSSEDTEFQETGERLEAYGVNAEWFIPSLNLGFFGRYGFVNNTTTDFDDDTFSFGLNVLDVFMDNDRLGLAYGRNLDISTDDDTEPDVLEVFYDFELLPNLRAGFTFQQRDSLRESFAGFRIRGNLDILP